MKGILDAGFRYTPSHSTDIRETFERILREREAREATARTPEEKGKNVLALNPRKAGSP